MFIEDWIQIVIIWTCRKIEFWLSSTFAEKLKLECQLSIHTESYILLNSVVSRLSASCPLFLPQLSRQLLWITAKWSSILLTKIFPSYSSIFQIILSLTHASLTNLLHIIMCKSKYAQKYLNNNCCIGLIIITLRRPQIMFSFLVA